MTVKSVCVYCGSSGHVDDLYKTTARDMGYALAAHGMELVYGGGHVGLMGIIADAALEKGGRVVGVIPEHIVAYEVEHTGLSEIHVVDCMHTRKQMMAERSDAFVVLPGGMGTMDETFEILTWKQIGLHRKPVVILNVDNFWNPFLDLMDHLIDKGFAQPDNKKLYKVATTIPDAFIALDESVEEIGDIRDKWQ